MTLLLTHEKPEPIVSEAYWRSLYFFNLYRLAVAGIFALSIFFISDLFIFGSQNPRLFAWVSSVYLLLALSYYGALRFFRLGFNLHLTLHVITDILALTLLMYASSGFRSGLAFMLLVVLAGAGLVGQGRLTLFFAALATLAVLLEQGYRVLEFGIDTAGFVQTGLIGIGFFATGTLAHLLARRALTNAELARQRGIELSDQLGINRRVIRDMQDGVLVVDGEGKLKQHNPQAETLLGVRIPPKSDLAAFSSVLAECYARWHLHGIEVSEMIRASENGRMLHARFLPAGDGGNALIYLEDMEQVRAQAQQMKLAALGRLAANMAHEIRNPLSAISHAAELLAEEHRAEKRIRLIRIIGDNSQRLNQLVSEILELGRRDLAQPEHLRLGAFVETFLEEFALREPRVRQVVTLKFVPDAMLCFDRAHLNRVLWNLLSNALRHCSGAAGAIRVEVLASNASAPLSGGTELHISDDGPGIDAAHREQVFEPFFTTHSKGTGLGLYIARELCEANGVLLELLDDSHGAHFRLVVNGGTCQ